MWKISSSYLLLSWMNVTLVWPKLFFWKQLSLVVNKVRNIWFLSPLVPSKQENLALLSLFTFWGKCVYFSIFEWQNPQLCQTKHNCKFYHSKLKNKHTFLKKYTNWAKLSSLVLREWEETKTRYFAPKVIKDMQMNRQKCNKLVIHHPKKAQMYIL